MDTEPAPRPAARVSSGRFDARCQLCSRVAGQVLSGTFLHHPDCALTPRFEAGQPRCCACGGRLYLEATDSPMSSAADREAARRYHPGRY